jgi:hypothetical protein
MSAAKMLRPVVMTHALVRVDPESKEPLEVMQLFPDIKSCALQQASASDPCDVYAVKSQILSVRISRLYVAFDTDAKNMVAMPQLKYAVRWASEQPGRLVAETTIPANI